MVKKKVHYSESMVPGGKVEKKRHYSDPEDPLENVIFKHLRPKEESATRARTFYVTDDTYDGAYRILGKRISSYVEDCLLQLIQAKAAIDEHAKGG